jgi:hypothetical protein
MFEFPDTEKKLKSRITRYKSSLKKEEEEHGFIHDGFGKRHLLFCFYFVLNNLDEAYEYFQWYKEKFPNDIGDPIQKLCWALSLKRMGKGGEAKYRLADLMLSNLYIIPYLLGYEVKRYDFWHATNLAEPEIVEYIFPEVIDNITDSEYQWMEELYTSDEFTRIRERYIEIKWQLEDTKNYEQRHKLVQESFSLLDNMKVE